MRKLLIFATSLLLMLSAPSVIHVSAGAEDAPAEIEAAAVLQNAAEVEQEKAEAEAPDLADRPALDAVSGPDERDWLLDWELNGYPDNVGGVYYDDADGKIVVMLVDPSEAAIAELQAQYADLANDSVRFGESRYSYNEMLAIQANFPDNANNLPIYGIGIGWTLVDGEVGGFGESGKEFRVIVNVDESALEEARNWFATQYGDIVYVEAGDMPAEADGRELFADDSSNGNRILLPVIAAAVLLAAVALILNRRRFISVFQSDNGEITAQSEHLGRRDVVKAVRENTLSPSDDVSASLMKRIHRESDHKA